MIQRDDNTSADHFSFKLKIIIKRERKKEIDVTKVYTDKNGCTFDHLFETIASIWIIMLWFKFTGTSTSNFFRPVYNF